MTELAPITTLLSPAEHRKGKLRCSVGRATAHAEVRVVDDHDQVVPTGTVGEIVARGARVMLGYWNRPEETAKALRGGWMHTGDAGSMCTGREALCAGVQQLRALVAAVRPGGWVVAEDPDHGGAMIPALGRYVDPPEHAELWERVLHGLDGLFTGVGADASFGPRLPRALAEAGLEQIGAELHTPLLHGGAGSFLRLTIQQLQAPLAGTGLVTDREIERFLELLGQPSFGHLPFVMVTAWGQRPAVDADKPS